MPSAAILEQKKKEVDALVEEVSVASAGVIVNYYKTNVEDDTKLRAACRKAGVEYKVIKNTMLRFVFNATNYSELNDNLNGMTAFAYSKDDVVAPAKVLADFAKDHENFEIKGVRLHGAQALHREAQTVHDVGHGIQHTQVVQVVAQRGADQEFHGHVVDLLALVFTDVLLISAALLCQHFADIGADRLIGLLFGGLFQAAAEGAVADFLQTADDHCVVFSLIHNTSMWGVILL